MEESCRGVAYLNTKCFLERRLLLPESTWFCCLDDCHACQISICGGAGALQHIALIKRTLPDNENELLPPSSRD